MAKPTHPRQPPTTVKDIICELRETLSEQYHRPAEAKLLHYYLRQDARLHHTTAFVPTSTRCGGQLVHPQQNPKLSIDNPVRSRRGFWVSLHVIAAFLDALQPFADHALHNMDTCHH